MVKSKVVFLAVLVAAISVLGPFSPVLEQKAAAANTVLLDSSEYIEDQVQNQLLSRAMYWCFKNGIEGLTNDGRKTYSSDDIEGGNFFDNDSTTAGYLFADDYSGSINCDDDDLLGEAVSELQWGSIQDLLCAMNEYDGLDGKEAILVPSGVSCKDADELELADDEWQEQYAHAYTKARYKFNRAPEYHIITDGSDDWKRETLRLRDFFVGHAKVESPSGTNNLSTNVPVLSTSPFSYIWGKRSIEGFCDAKSGSYVNDDDVVIMEDIDPDTGGGVGKDVTYKLKDASNWIVYDAYYSVDNNIQNEACSRFSESARNSKALSYSIYLQYLWNLQVAMDIVADLKELDEYTEWADKGDKELSDQDGTYTSKPRDFVANSTMNGCLESEKAKLYSNDGVALERRYDVLTDCMHKKLPKAIQNLTDKVDKNQSQDEQDQQGEGDETTCAIDGIGWMICPAMNFLAKMNDLAFGFLKGLLSIRPALITDAATLTAWSAFRDIANVAFVIAFLVIVYSQITSAGVSNYGIKKLLPRIVIAAILVNVSYFICAIMVDLSNIVGSSVYSLLGNSINVGGNGSSGGESWSAIMGAVLAVAATVLLVVIIILAPTVLLALAMILLILVARQAFVILLIVASPLAFVAYLLPNTESWFKKWWKAFVAVLMVYPIVGVVFGASTLASNIIMNVAGGSGDDEQFLKIIALAVLAVPLFAVPAILKGSMGAAGAVGAKLAALQDRANRRAGGDVKDRASKEWKNVNDRLTARALNPERGRLASALGIRRRASARTEKRFDEGDRLRKSAEDVFTTTDRRASARERSALGAEETASKMKQVQQNEVKLDHLESNAPLHTQAIQSGLNLHNAEATHKSEVEADHQRNPNNYAQYQRLNQSAGEKQNADLETKNRFEGSDAGNRLSQDRQGLEGELDLTKDHQKREFKGSDLGRQQAVAKDAVTQGIKVEEGLAEVASVGANRQVRVEAAAIGTAVEAAKSGEAALVQELKTEAGAEKYADSNPELADSATILRNNDTELRVETQRAGAAKRAADVEYAHEVQKDSTGLATRAGGIEGDAGVSQARAVATQTIIEAFKKGVAAESTLLSSTNEDVILSDKMLGSPDILDQPDEKISAMGSTIAKRQHMTSHIKLWDRMGKLQNEVKDEKERADKITDPAAKAEALEKVKAKKEKLVNLQQMVMQDKSKKPFGIGDEDQGKATVGEYDSDIYESTRKRILSHLSDGSLSSMDPDDMRLIYEMGRDGKLGPDHIKKIQDSYEAWEKNPNLKHLLKDKSRALMEPIVYGDYSADTETDPAKRHRYNLSGLSDA